MYPVSVTFWRSLLVPHSIKNHRFNSHKELMILFWNLHVLVTNSTNNCLLHTYSQNHIKFTVPTPTNVVVICGIS